MRAQILLVDDESVTRRLVTYTLKAIDVEVISAEDGLTAIAMADTLEIVMAIVDINLPDINGFEVIQRLKEVPRLQNVPMIMFTARSDPDDKHHALEVGAEGFLYKPFSTQELRDLVKRYM